LTLAATTTPGWEKAAREADWTLELPGDGGPMFFRKIEPGEFRMGSRYGYPSEQPEHLVRLESPFYLGTFPVIQRQFRAWTNAEKVKHENGFPRKDDPIESRDLLPAENMDWREARRFCVWLSRNCRLPEGYHGDLPSEAQWEYACRAGTGTEYANGDGESALREIGWFDENSGERTHPCGELQANAFGLYDMHGNVWEWCLDAWDGEAYRKVVDGRIADDRASRERVSLEDGSSVRVMRGGSWDCFAGWCRSAYRDRFHPGGRDDFLGFRVCLLPGPVSGPVSRGARGQARAEAEGGAGRRGGKPSRHAPPEAGADPWDDLVLPEPPAESNP